MLDAAEWSAYRLVCAMRTQWRHGFDGTPTGIRYESLAVAAAAYGEPLDAERTRLTVRQFGTASPKEYSGYANGWASFMVAFKRSREDGPGGK